MSILLSMMTDRDKLMSEVRSYCAAMKISPSTLSVRALGNSRFFDRFKRRLEKEAEDADRLLAYMAQNPPSEAKTAGQDAA